ncbi:MAG TPA: phage portal protein, partial [Anaerolineae bacterium]|nr:phage portal protein [Anaerolineae bacterium]
MTTSIMGGQLGTKAVSLGQLDSFLDWLVDGKDSKMPKDLYAEVAWNFWAVNLRADSIAQVPYAVYPMDMPEGDETEDNAVEFDIDLKPYLWAAEAWLQLMGAAYWLKRANRVGLQALQVLNSQTMRLLKWDADGPVSFVQQVGALTQIYKAEEIVYFRTFSPDTDLGPGVSSGHVAATESTLIRNANEWAAKFFEKGAIPSVILSTDQAIPDSE